MYLTETYKGSQLCYKVTDNGLVNIANENALQPWKWDDIIEYYNKRKTSHEWNVLTDDEMFLEQL